MKLSLGIKNIQSFNFTFSVCKCLLQRLPERVEEGTWFGRGDWNEARPCSISAWSIPFRLPNRNGTQTTQTRILWHLGWWLLLTTSSCACPGRLGKSGAFNFLLPHVLTNPRADPRPLTLPRELAQGKHQTSAEFLIKVAAF